MKEIKLTQGKIALVDDEDFEYLSKFKWFAFEDGQTFYVRRQDFLNNTVIPMHCYILRLDSDNKRQIDHRNGNGLDNRKENLRICTHQENGFNRRISINNTSGYKGVSWHKSTKKWRTQIKYNKKTFHLGYFKNKENAAQIYNEMALKYFGEFARLNIIGER